MNAFKRLQNLWRLSNLPSETVLKKVEEIIEHDEAVGDGVVIPEMSHAEYERYQVQQENGWGKFYDQLQEVIKKGDETPPAV